jgi:hypothetical protein
MTDQNRDKNQLFQAFREDHATLGKAFYELGQSLRAGDLKQATSLAKRLDVEAGAHIAFEERDFYPALRRLLGDEDVDQMEEEHRIGYGVVKTLADLPPDQPLPEKDMERLLRDSDAMSEHIAECGELFGAMGGLDDDEQRLLLDRLLEWRRRRPSWSDVDEKPDR